MEPSVKDLIVEALEKVGKETSTREASLVITKLQEALMWYNQHKTEQKAKLEASGVGVR